MWVRLRWKYNSLHGTKFKRVRVPDKLSRLLVRVAIASVLVFACYRFDWHLLRNITASIIVRLSHSLGLPVSQPAPDVMEMDGTFYVFYISCTMIDVFFAAMALMWNSHMPFLRNLLRVVYLFLFVFAVNILRLETGLQLLHRFHVPDIVEHEIVGGIAYFIVLMKVVDTRINGPNEPSNAIKN